MLASNLLVASCSHPLSRACPAVAASMLAGQTAVAADGEGEAAQKHHTHSYCCIDYPRFIDTLQVGCCSWPCRPVTDLYRLTRRNSQLW